MNKITFTLIISIILNLGTCTITMFGATRDGGHHDEVNDHCDEAYKSMHPRLQALGHNVEMLKIISCRTQVVAGMKYMFELENEHGEVCTMSVWRKVNREMEALVDQSTCLNGETQEESSSQSYVTEPQEHYQIHNHYQTPYITPNHHIEAQFDTPYITPNFNHQNDAQFETPFITPTPDENLLNNKSKTMDIFKLTSIVAGFMFLIAHVF